MAYSNICLKSLTFIPIILIIGCQMESKVEVVQEQNGVIQIAASVRGNKSPCVKNVYIYHVFEGKMITDWQIFLNEGRMDFCVNQFTYPNIPPHYSLAGNPRPLKEAHVYNVSVTGVGFLGEEEFTRIKLPSKTP
jgi:hypothetical protein